MDTHLNVFDNLHEKLAGSHLRRSKIRHEFQAKASTKHLARLGYAQELGVPLQVLFLGIAVTENSNGSLDIGFAAHDGTYSIDFAVHTLGDKPAGTSGLGSATSSGAVTPSEHSAGIRSGANTPSGFRSPLPPEERAGSLATFCIEKVRGYQKDHWYKFIGAGINKVVAQMSPHLPSRLWAELDIVPMVFESPLESLLSSPRTPSTIAVDEMADSMARKCLMFFGPTQLPRVQVGYRNEVEVDCSGHAQITCIDQYPRTVGARTWEATMKYVKSLRDGNVKIAFFNSTPQGGGVALMRHALIRFLRLVGVNASWYVPKPKPEVFRITKTNHNILQGVADAEERLTERQKKTLDEWCQQNAERFWVSDGGPLAPRANGGADVIIVDDPQMPSLVRLSKQLDQERPVIFRSHIQVRADLADKPQTPTAGVWDWLWNHVQLADVFVSHPVREFVPSSVDFNKVGYMPATTDWLDGLNKGMDEWDTRYYIHLFNNECIKNRSEQLDFQKRPYIVQIARFDPSKGIPHVLASYAELRRKYMKDADPKEIPQLVIAGHGAIDDPDASLILDQTFSLLETMYFDIRTDIVVMRLGPTDQILNALVSNARVALQLSSREGFEVKVSEAVHKGVPIIATRAGGIPLQVEHGKSGFLVEVGDAGAVAKYLHLLLTDQEMYDRMSDYAASHVSDEVSTVGNALSWLYLADTLAKGTKIEPNCRWINDMAREAAGFHYVDGEPRLPRDEKLDLTMEEE